MALYDLDKGVRKVTPESICTQEMLQAYLIKEHPKTIKRVIATVDEVIDQAVFHGVNNSKFIWTKTGVLLGHQALGSKKHVDHVWESIIDTMGDDTRAPMFAIGLLVRWRIALRTEKHWLTMKQESNKRDELTGEKISVATYWINPEFTPYKG